MKKLIAGGLLVLSTQAFAGGDVLGLIGQRSFNDDVWDNLDQDKQPMLGVMADFTFGTSPVGLAVALHASGDDSNDVETGTAEISVGAHFMPSQGSFRPFVGVGVSSVGVSVDDNFMTDDTDQSFGYYANGGILFRVAKHFDMGVELRYLGGTDLEIDGVQFDVDSFSAAFMIGGGWGT